MPAGRIYNVAFRLIRRVICLRVLCLAAVLPFACLAQIGEYEVKAAFLLNFTKFVDWPPSAFSGPAAPFAICILGPDPFGGALEQVTANENVAGRKLIVRRLDQVPAPQLCQMLFVSEEGKSLERTLKAVPPAVLTVGDSEGFLRAGGMIQFVVESRRVRFDIQKSAAEHAALRMSARLLGVARRVNE